MRDSPSIGLPRTLLLSIAILAPVQAISRMDCEKLSTLLLPGATALNAQDVPAGNTVSLARLLELRRLNPFVEETLDLPAFCRVRITVEHNVNIEVWLPKGTWNGRFRAEGGGSYGGYFNYWALADALHAGYATAGTDTGHHSSVGGKFALNANGSLNHQLIADFAWRSQYEMTLKAKAIIKAHYGKLPRYSYWRGASGGGREGLMFVQRFPEEYDGVLVGCPAINWDRFTPSMLWPQVVVREEVGRPISASKLESVTKAAIDACDGTDGIVDGIINNPRECHFDPSESTCNDAGDPELCLTPQEAVAIRKIWEGPKNQLTGKRLWFGLERGAPLSFLAGDKSHFVEAFPVAHFRYWLKQDASFDWRSLKESDFEQNITASHLKFNKIIGTDSPNLQAFQKHGGKLLIWHGESDELIFPRGTLNYFERVLASNSGAENVGKFARLFMLPGIRHYGLGGDAPFPGPDLMSPDSMFSALVNWVEKGIAPDRIPAYQKLPDGTVRTRPLCVYPQIASWTGRGSFNDAVNFTCADGEYDTRNASLN